MENMYYCPNCGAPVMYGVQFCSNCGVTLDWSGQQMPPPPPPQPYDYEYYDQPGAWDQQEPPYGQQSGWGQPPPPAQPQDWGYQGQYQQQDKRRTRGTGVQKKGSWNTIILLSVLLVIVCVIGGIGFATDWTFFMEQKQEQDTPPVAETEPEVVSFSLSSPMITQGQTTTLRWDTEGATSVSINQGIGDVSVSGTQVVSPTKSTTYTLTAANDYGSATKSVTVTVTPLDLPEITEFSADPATIESGESSTLEWDVDGATSVSINQNVGSVSTSGTKVVSPTSTTTYTLTATNTYGSVTDTVTVTVEGDLPEITAFTASPTTITSGGTSTLTWDVDGATSISINQSIGTVSESGTKVVSPTATTTYTLTATNSFGSATDTVKVTVTSSELPEIVSFEADPDDIDNGDESVLSWEVAGATSISINQGIGTVSESGTRTVTPSITITYTLTATNSYGSVTDTVTVTVDAGDKPQVTSFTANPEEIQTGSSSTLSWSVTNALEVEIDNDIGHVATSGSQQVQPTNIGITTYTLTATNEAGSVTAYVSVEVHQFLPP